MAALIVLCAHCKRYNGTDMPAVSLSVDRDGVQVMGAPGWVPLCEAHKAALSAEGRIDGKYPAFDFNAASAPPAKEADADEDADNPIVAHFDTSIRRRQARVIISDLMGSLPDSSGESLRYVSGNHDLLQYTFMDEPDEEGRNVDEGMLLSAFKFLFSNKWDEAAVPAPPHNNDDDEWDNWINECDGTAACDYFVQLAIFQDIIYP